MKTLVGNSPFLSLALFGLLAALVADRSQQWLFWSGSACALLCVALFGLLCLLDFSQETEVEKRMRTLSQARADTFRAMLEASGRELDEVEALLEERASVVRQAAQTQKQLVTYRGDWKGDADALEAAAEELEGVLSELREIRLTREEK